VYSSPLEPEGFPREKKGVAHLRSGGADLAGKNAGIGKKNEKGKKNFSLKKKRYVCAQGTGETSRTTHEKVRSIDQREYGRHIS